MEEQALAVRTLVREFSGELFTRLARAEPGNLICSPYSVAAVLGMVAAGARGQTLAELLKALHADDATILAPGLGALGPELGARAWTEDSRQLELSAANSVWGQAGYPWEQGFLDVLDQDFGAGLRQVDYREPETARRSINAWASEQTRGRIPQIIPSGVLHPDSRLTLVNAVYFKGPWRTPFRPERTQDGEFHRLDGATVTVPMMHGTLEAGYAEGPGWVAADLPYAHGELAMAVVVPEGPRRSRWWSRPCCSRPS